MENKFDNQVREQSTSELKEIVINVIRYQELLIIAAQNELLKRGIELNEEEKEQQEKNKAEKIKLEESEKEFNYTSGWLFSKERKNIVKDTTAPQLYTKSFIYIGTFLFSTLFGGILTAINLNKVNRGDKAWLVIIFSIIYLISMISILNHFERNTLIAIIMNSIGVIILDSIFWKKYIGNETKYRSKPIWIPLIIGIVLTVLISWLIYIGK